MTTDYSQEIYKLLVSYLPVVNAEIGQVMPAVDISIVEGSVIIELSEDDYSFIQNQIEENSNYSYTTSGFRVKNRLSSFEIYPENASSAFAFLASFNKPMKCNAGDEINLKGFDQSSYNTLYKVVRKIDDSTFILSPANGMTIIAPSGNIGFYPILYSDGFNGLKTISDAGDSQISFEIDESLISITSSVDDLDLDIMPNLWFYQNNIIVANLTTFLKNLADGTNDDFLLIDSSSLSGSPVRSKHNNTDAPYFAFSSNAYFHRSYTINIAYILKRSIDDEDNMTKTGADIASKQADMFRKLNSILGRPMISSDQEFISSVRITEDSISDVIMEGSVIINYQCSFVVNYLPQSILDISDSAIHEIKQVNYNTDQIIV